MAEIKPDRRSRPRVPVRVPVAIHSKDGTLQTTGHTRDFSETGIFVFTQTKIVPGSELEMVLVLPPELTHGKKRWVCCRASVVRVEDGTAPGNFGIAADILSVQILPEIAG